MLTAHKVVNLSWICAVCGSLVKVPSDSATYWACIRGHELTICPATIAVALGIAVEAKYDYLIRFDHPTISFDAIVSEISDGRRRSWSGKL